MKRPSPSSCLCLSLLGCLSLAAGAPRAAAVPITSGAGPGGVGYLTSGNLTIWLKADSIAQADNTAVSQYLREAYRKGWEV